MGGCAQTEDLVSDIKESALAKPAKLFSTDNWSVPSWAKPNEAGNNFNLRPKGPVAATDLISATGYCAPAAEPPAPAPQAAAPQAASTAQAAAPPPDRLEPAGGFGPSAQVPVAWGVTFGMSECAVARRLGTPSNVSISAGPKGQRRVVLTYTQGERPGVYSFRSGRLIQVDATPQEAKRYDKQVKKPRRRGGRQVDRMYVQ